MSKEETLLENFIFDDNLKMLEKQYELNRFNIFDCLKLTRAEIRHSNFLAWLLDPNETHGLGDYFLKIFLQQVIRSYKNEISNITGYNIPSVFDIDCWDMSNTQVKREQEYIDILAVDETNSFVFIIENKIDTCQHDNQLSRYRQYVDEQYPSSQYKKLFMYLKPKTEIVEQPYIYISYGIIKESLEMLLAEKSDKLNDEISTIIIHYKKTIERDIMNKDEIGKICKQIYKQHKTAIDLINKYRGNVKDEIFEALKSIIENDENLCYKPSNVDWIRFIPKEADYNNLNIAIQDWVESENLLIFEVHNKANSIDIDIVIRRVNDDNADKRALLLDLAKTNLNYKKSNKKDSYDHVKSVQIVKPSDYDDFILQSYDDLQNNLKSKIYESGIIDDFIKLATDFDRKFSK